MTMVINDLHDLGQLGSWKSREINGIGSGTSRGGCRNLDATGDVISDSRDMEDATAIEDVLGDRAVAPRDAQSRAAPC
jgi:hypothetical protein